MHRIKDASRILSVAFGIIAALAGKGFSATFSNSTPIAIPAPGNSSGSEISVSGLGNSLTSVSVTADNITATDAGDVDLVLVGPTGAALVLMGDCGESTSLGIFNLTFSDAALSALPENALISAGSYKPTQFASIGSFPSPGPSLDYDSPPPFGSSTFATTFAGTNPDGNWSLYVMDPVSGDSGGLSNGWSLQITAVPEPASLSLVAIAAMSLMHRRSRQGGLYERAQ